MNTNMNVADQVKQVEKELVELIIEHLKANKIAVETARQQARDFLALLPMNDQKDLLNKLKNLGDKYEEAKTVYAEELGKVEETKRQQTLDNMRLYIRAGDIDSAIAAAKAMYPEKNLQNPEQGIDQPIATNPVQASSTTTGPTNTNLGQMSSDNSVQEQKGGV